MGNPIKYTSKTYNSVILDINSDPLLIDKPEFFKRMIAGAVDNNSVQNDAIANQSFLRTAFTKQAVVDHLEHIDYYLTPQSTSDGWCRFDLNGSVTFPIIITKENLAAVSLGSIAVASKRYEARASVVVNAVTEIFAASDVTDILTVTRVFTTGEKVRFTTTGTLPAGLAINTDYWVIYVSDTEIRIATTRINADNDIYIDITNTGTGVHTIHLFSFNAELFQQDIIAPYVVGQSDGSTEWQEFNLIHQLVLRDQVNVVINSEVWSRVDSFIDSTSISKHYKLLYRTDGIAYLYFGDGTYGKIPSAFDINVDYAVGGGSDSNVFVLGKINVYAGSSANITAVENYTEFTGGGNEESIESAKRLAPVLLKARDRFITTTDGEGLAKTYPGVANVKINRLIYGLLSCQVMIVPNGGGLPSPSLRTALQNFLISRTVLESIDVRVDIPIYVVTNVTSAFKPLSGYVYADVLPFFKLGWQLLLSEVGVELLELHIANGVAASVVFINAKWGYTFVPADYQKIKVLVDALDIVGAAQFGVDRQFSDVAGYLDTFVEGVDYLTIASPSFPLGLSSDEITSDGIITVTEIP